MPFKLATIGRQRSLATLARSLYALKDSPGLQERAEAALLRANPALAGDTLPPAGATVVVPEIPGLASTDTVQPATASAAPEAPLLEDFGAALEALLPRLEQESAEELRLLQSQEFFKVLMTHRPDLDSVVPEIIKAAGEDAEALILHGKQLREAVDRAQADRKRLPG